MNDFTFTKEAFEDYLYWQIQDKKTMKRINTLLKDIRSNGAMKGTGKQEKLKYVKYPTTSPQKRESSEDNFILKDYVFLRYLYCDV